MHIVIRAIVSYIDGETLPVQSYYDLILIYSLQRWISFNSGPYYLLSFSHHLSPIFLFPKYHPHYLFSWSIVLVSYVNIKDNKLMIHINFKYHNSMIEKAVPIAILCSFKHLYRVLIPILTACLLGFNRYFHWMFLSLIPS